MAQQEMSRVRLDEMRGASVYDNTGDKIGEVKEIYYDEGTLAPQWIGIGTGFFGTKRVAVPFWGAASHDDGLMVPYSKDFVKDSPEVDQELISQRNHVQLVGYYGLASREVTPSIEPDRQSVTRAEEEIEVGTRPVDAGSVRLRKWVETEPVTLEVELRRDVAHITREPINEPMAEHEFGDEQVDMPLSKEKVVVQKRTVAKERIGVEKDVETDREQVTDEVRKERVEVEGDVDETRGRA